MIRGLSAELRAGARGLNASNESGVLQDTACYVCFDNEGDNVFLPCGHGGCCGMCARQILSQPHQSRLCPVCRAYIAAVAQIHLTTPIGSNGDVLEATSGIWEPPSDINVARVLSNLPRQGRNAATHST